VSTRFPVKCLFTLAALLLTVPAPFAQERLVIDVGKRKRPPASSGVIHYQGTGSVRHSEQRTYESAQTRHTVQAAENRTEVQAAEGRTTVDAQARKEVQNAEDRTYGKATSRHGSVRLDTIR
jgi:hypothetical protein